MKQTSFFLALNILGSTLAQLTQKGERMNEGSKAAAMSSVNQLNAIAELETQQLLGEPRDYRRMGQKAEVTSQEAFLQGEKERKLAFEYFKELAKNTFEKVKDPIATLHEDGTPNLDPQAYEADCVQICEEPDCDPLTANICPQEEDQEEGDREVPQDSVQFKKQLVSPTEANQELSKSSGFSILGIDLVFVAAGVGILLLEGRGKAKVAQSERVEETDRTQQQNATEMPTIRQDVSVLDAPVQEQAGEEQVGFGEAFWSYSTVGVFASQKAPRLLVLLQLNALLFCLLALSALLVGAFQWSPAAAIPTAFALLQLFLPLKRMNPSRAFAAVAAILLLALSTVAHLVTVAYFMHTPSFNAFLVTALSLFVIEVVWDLVALPKLLSSLANASPRARGLLF